MKVKDSSVGTLFHPMLTALLFKFEAEYNDWGSELTITSGSEPETKHSVNSLHYATPCQAADIRIWEVANVPSPEEQLSTLRVAADEFCAAHGIPTNWIDLILESHHIHCEYQPKRRR